MLEEDDGMSFADFLASVQEEEKKGKEKEGIKLSNISFNGSLWATVNEHWYAFYDGEKLETNAPVNKDDLEFLLEKEFNSYIPSPFVEALQDLNSCCEHDENFGVLITDDYNFKQIQEGDRQGWTLVYNRDKKIIAYMNWQACGCHVETIDDGFYDFLRWETKKGAVYAGLDDPMKVYDLESFQETVDGILRLESEWVSDRRGKDNIHFFQYSEKEKLEWESELLDDMRDVLCDERYYKAKDPVDFALRCIKSIVKYNPRKYKDKKLTRRLIKEFLKTAEESLTGD